MEILGLIIVVLLVLAIHGIPKFPCTEQNVERCSLHYWALDHDEKMVCAQCNYRPGDNN